MAIPPNSRIGVDMKAIHFNPEIYPDPDRCDLFRFSKLREEPGNDIKYGFSSVDSDVCLRQLYTVLNVSHLPIIQYLPFGAGMSVLILHLRYSRKF